MAQYQRDKDGARLGFHGMDTVHPPDALLPGKYVYAQNLRAYLRDSVRGRATQDSTVLSLPSSVHSLRRLNDTTPAGPAAGFILVAGAGSNIYANGVQVDSGLSGNHVSLLPFRPNASVQPWMYLGDTLKMSKVRSDGLRRKMGIAEPQAAPTITSVPISAAVSLIGSVTATSWFDSPHDGPVGVYIWKNASDVSGIGPVRSSTPANAVTVGNSLIFDLIPATVHDGQPMNWTVYTVNNGTVDTDETGAHNVHWVSGDDFGNLQVGQQITIGTTVYTIDTLPSNILLTVTSAVGVQTGVNYSAVAQSGTQPVFTGASYENWNMVVEATLYIPAAGAYTFTISSHDDCLWGIGGNQSGQPTWAAPSGGAVLSVYGQTKTAKNGYPLMPRNNGHASGGYDISYSVSVTFPAAGNYPIELDYDFWYHSNRHLIIQCNGKDIAPLPATVITDAQYRYRYRASETGAKSNGSPPSPEQAISVLANTLVATPSTDPQVDKIDWFRFDVGLLNYTYVGTGPNSTAPFSDTLLDTDVANNPILEEDNFEPFPSIDLPRKGTVNVSGGVVSWASGDHFNVRWLPGTVIVIGTVAYTLDKRPTSTTQLTASNVEIVGGFSIVVPVPDGTGLTYEIAEPKLAAQPLPYIWGPTDNVSFAFGVGDPIRPGVLYWCKGNDLDSAPDTNQMDVTSPSEPLQNGCIVAGYGWVASTERAWLIIPNFFNALATVTGTVGSTWTLQESELKRGLYIPRCLAVDGGANVFFRAKDGVYISPGGQGGQSITDEDLYNLFPHEGFKPQAVTRGAYTVYPPDDTRPQYQKFEIGNGYLYYDYVDINGYFRTLVFDIAAKGWVIDEYEHPARIHYWEEGVVNEVLTGCSNGSVRPLTDTGTESECAILLTRCENAGETRAQKHWGDLYIEVE